MVEASVTTVGDLQEGGTPRFRVLVTILDGLAHSSDEMVDAGFSGNAVACL